MSASSFTDLANTADVSQTESPRRLQGVFRLNQGEAIWSNAWTTLGSRRRLSTSRTPAWSRCT